MASSARIEELQKKFDENPKRYFAPLANEFRKAGDLEQAIALCRAFLPQQPAHMSGHIVFGQALFEAKQHEEARTVFETALSLDPENLIALRYLGDIARETGDIAAASSWYRRVLDADPRNDEIAALLAGLPAEGSVELPAAGADAGSAGDIELALPEPAAAGAAPAAEPQAREDAGPLSMRESLDMPAIPEPPAGEIERSQEVDLGELVEPAFATDAPSGEAAPAAFTGTGPANELGFEVMEFVPPARSDEPPRPNGFQEVVPEDADGATPAAFVTETMAELYLQQGFHEEALAVYRQLLAQNPNDVGLRERVEQLASGARSSVGAAAVSDAVIESAQRRRTAGSARTIRSFLASLAGRRVVRNPDSETGEERASAAEPETGQAWELIEERGGEPPAPRRQPTPAWTPAEVPDFDDEESSSTELPWIEPPAESARESEASVETIRTLETVEPRGTQDGGEAYDANDAPAAAAVPAVPVAPVVEASRSARLSGEMGSVNTLFTGAPVTSDDAAAAEMLAGAFLAPEPAAAADRATSAGGRPARAAASELSLDNVFREPGQRTSTEQRRSPFSFDQFFSEGGSAEGGDSDADPGEASPDDIAQFNAWLEGLKKK